MTASGALENQARWARRYIQKLKSRRGRVMEDQEPYTIDLAELKLTPKQEKAIFALLEEPTLKKAAATAGVNPTTLWRWLKTTDFRQAYMLARWKAVQQGIA